MWAYSSRIQQLSRNILSSDVREECSSMHVLEVHVDGIHLKQRSHHCSRVQLDLPILTGNTPLSSSQAR